MTLSAPTCFLLIPGSHHGGWWYEPLVQVLEAEGHLARAVTLPGLDPVLDEGPPTRVITLTDHVDAAASDLAQLLAAAREHASDPRVVLVGHSYGGSIVSALADAMPARVHALVYLDALLPHDGDSSWSMTTQDEHEWYVEGSARTGAYVDPLPFFDDRARPHPLATLMQASSLGGAWREVPVKHYVVATQWPGPSPMALMAERARADESIRVHEWDTTHNVLKDGPELVHALLREVAADL